MAIRRIDPSLQGRMQDERARIALAGEAAEAAWRAWRYPLGNRSANLRDATAPDLHSVPREARDASAETAWTQVMARDPRGLG